MPNNQTNPHPKLNPIRFDLQIQSPKFSQKVRIEERKKERKKILKTGAGNDLIEAAVEAAAATAALADIPTV
jgi:hypothetical protein